MPATASTACQLQQHRLQTSKADTKNMSQEYEEHVHQRERERKDGDIYIYLCIHILYNYIDNYI